jgi:hypothetical protein
MWCIKYAVVYIPNLIIIVYPLTSEFHTHVAI